MATSTASWFFVRIPTKEKEIAYRKEHEDDDDAKKLACKLYGSRFKCVDLNDVDFVGFATFEESLEDAVEQLKIVDAVRIESVNGDFLVWKFCVVGAERVEQTLMSLQQRGIGNSALTSVSVFNSVIHMSHADVKKAKAKAEDDVVEKDEDAKTVEEEEDNDGDGFAESIKSRLLVAEVVARIKAGTQFSFDFLMLLVLAGCISFFGLIENNAVVLVASMLVSPLMGPILAAIFGFVIKDEALRNKGVKSEILALAICVGIGFVLGLIFVPWIDTYGVLEWPPGEMTSRGHWRGLYVGVLIAIPSGAGVAISVLGGNAGSLVGVAISASLLPPAVNCGIFFADAVITSIVEGPNVNETFYYFEGNRPLDNVTLGLVSLALTLVNILCIAITGVAILKLKEVTPAFIPQAFPHFWKKDIRTHRDYLETVGHENAEELLVQARDVLGHTQTPEGIGGTFLHDLFEDDQDHMIDIRNWVAQPLVPPKPTRPKTAQNRPKLRFRSYTINTTSRV